MSYGSEIDHIYHCTINSHKFNDFDIFSYSITETENRNWEDVMIELSRKKWYAIKGKLKRMSLLHKNQV